MSDLSTPDSNSNVIFERPRDTAKALGVSVATFWRKVKDEPGFPQPVRLGPQSVAIVQSERIDYQKKKIAERDAVLAAKRQAEGTAAE